MSSYESEYDIDEMSDGELTEFLGVLERKAYEIRMIQSDVMDELNERGVNALP